MKGTWPGSSTHVCSPIASMLSVYRTYMHDILHVHVRIQNTHTPTHTHTHTYIHIAHTHTRSLMFSLPTEINRTAVAPYEAVPLAELLHLRHLLPRQGAFGDDLK